MPSSGLRGALAEDACSNTIQSVCRSSYGLDRIEGDACSMVGRSGVRLSLFARPPASQGSAESVRRSACADNAPRYRASHGLTMPSSGLRGALAEHAYFDTIQSVCRSSYGLDRIEGDACFMVARTYMRLSLIARPPSSQGPAESVRRSACADNDPRPCASHGLTMPSSGRDGCPQPSAAQRVVNEPRMSRATSKPPYCRQIGTNPASFHKFRRLTDRFSSCSLPTRCPVAFHLLLNHPTCRNVQAGPGAGE